MSIMVNQKFYIALFNFDVLLTRFRIGCLKWKCATASRRHTEGFERAARTPKPRVPSSQPEHSELFQREFEFYGPEVSQESRGNVRIPPAVIV